MIAAAAAEAGAVVGQHLAENQAERSVVGHGGAQERARAVALLIGQDLCVTDPGRIVDSDRHVLPACVIDLAAPIAVDATPDTRDPAEIFHVKMQQLAGLGPLAAAHRRQEWSRRSAGP